MGKRTTPKHTRPKLRELGVRAAVQVLEELEGDEDLRESCDPEAATGAMRNIIWEQLDKRIAEGERDFIEGFCLAFTGYVSIVCGGIVPGADHFRREMKCRLLFDRAAAIAKRDTKFQKFISVATATPKPL